MADTFLYDSQQDFQGGMQGGFDPGHVADDQYFRGVNISVRNGVLAPRPSFKEIDLDFTTMTTGSDAQSIAQNNYNNALTAYNNALAASTSYINDGNTIKNSIAAIINTTYSDASNSTYTQPTDLAEFLKSITNSPRQYESAIFGQHSIIQNNTLTLAQNYFLDKYGVVGVNLPKTYKWTFNEGETEIPQPCNIDVKSDNELFNIVTQAGNSNNINRILPNGLNLTAKNPATDNAYEHNKPFAINYTPKSGAKLTDDLIACLQIGQRNNLYTATYVENPPTTSTTITQTHINNLIKVLYGDESSQTVKLDLTTPNSKLDKVTSFANIATEFNGTISEHQTVDCKKAVRLLPSWDFENSNTGPSIIKRFNRESNEIVDYANNRPIPWDVDTAANNGVYNYRYGNIPILPNDNPEEWLIARADNGGALSYPTISPALTGTTNQVYNARSFAHIRAIAQLLVNTEQSLDAEVIIRVKLQADLSVTSTNATDNANLQKRKVSRVIPFPIKNLVPKIGGILKSTTDDIQGTITSFNFEYADSNWSQAGNDDGILVNDLRPYFVYFGLKDLKRLDGTSVNNDIIGSLRRNAFGDNVQYQGLDNAYNTIVPPVNHLQNYNQVDLFNKRSIFQEKKNSIIERGYYDIYANQYLASQSFGTNDNDYKSGYVPMIGSFEDVINSYYYDFQNNNEILINEDFETGSPGDTTGFSWETTGGSGYTITLTNDGTADGGSQYAQIRGRTASWHGIKQSVINHINRFANNRHFIASAKVRTAGSNIPSCTKMGIKVSYSDNTAKTYEMGTNITSDVNSFSVLSGSLKFIEESSNLSKTITDIDFVINGKNSADLPSGEGYSATNNIDLDTFTLKETTSPGLHLKQGFFGNEWEVYLTQTEQSLETTDVGLNQAAAQLNSTGLNFNENFQRGRFQGSLLYKTPNAAYNICVISGHVYMINLENYKVTVVTRNDTKLNQDVEKVYMVQAERHFIIQDGINTPRILTGASLKLSDTANRQVPVGTNMAYGQGRLTVQVSEKHFRIGDIHLSYAQNNVLNFKETEFLNEGGGFTVSGKLGKIVSLQFANVADSSTGDGPLLAICENGFSTFAINNARAQWNNIAIQKVQMIGTAMTGKDAYVNINEDILYRSPEGVRSYAVGRSEANSGFRFSEITKEVDPYIENDSNADIEYVRLSYFDKRLLITTGSKLVTTEGNEYTYWTAKHALQTLPDATLTDETWETLYIQFLIDQFNGQTNGASSFEAINGTSPWKRKRWADELDEPTNDGSPKYQEALQNRYIVNNKTIVNGNTVYLRNNANKTAFYNSINALPESTTAEKYEKAYLIEKFFELYFIGSGGTPIDVTGATVSGAGTTAVNGTYSIYTGSLTHLTAKTSSTVFKNGSFYLYQVSNSQWRIDTDASEDNGYYTNTATTDNPPTSGWASGNEGDDPAPSLSLTSVVNNANNVKIQNWYEWVYTYLQKKKQILKDTVFQGLISFDFSLAGYTKSTKQSQSARLKSGSYDGLWTGLNITDIFTHTNAGIKKCLIHAKRKNDNANTLYELTKDITGCDYGTQTNYKTVKIQQSVDLRAMPFKTAQTYIDSPFVFKHLDDLTLWLANIHDTVTIECFAKSDVVTQFTKIGEVTVLAATEDTTDPSKVGQPQSRAMLRLKDLTEQYDTTTSHPIRNGNEFQFRLKWAGNIQIRRFLVAARKITAPKLDNVETTKTTYPVDTYNEFGYSAN